MASTFRFTLDKSSNGLIEGGTSVHPQTDVLLREAPLRAPSH